MPGFTTHYLFGVDAYKRIPHNHIRENLYHNHSAFSLGLQGPDLFFYYFPSYFLHKKNIGDLAHSQDTGAFFSYLLESRTLFTGKKHALAVADAYLTGFLGHYTLDCTTHPFIYAHTSYTPMQPPKNTQYFGQHAYLETEIDNQLLMIKKQLKPSRFHQNATIHLNPLQKSVIAKMLCYAYRNTYPALHINERMMYGAFFCMSQGTRLVNDPSGQKKVLARFVEKTLLGRAFLSPMVPSDEYRFVSDPLNLSHHNWTHPWTQKASTTSFLDLYLEAGKLYDRRIRHYYALVQSGFKPEDCSKFCQSYGCLSFQSGLPL